LKEIERTNFIYFNDAQNKSKHTTTNNKQTRLKIVWLRKKKEKKEKQRKTKKERKRVRFINGRCFRSFKRTNYF